MTTARDLKAELKAGQPAFGVWIELFSPMAAEILAQAGYDCAMIDLEHGPGSYLDAVSVMQAMRAGDAVPMLRVESNDAVAIKRALDIGISGIMIPAVNSAAEAEAAVAACRYPPNGMRGCAVGIVRASDYGSRWQDYMAEVDERLLVICQIESAAAVENVEAIAAVAGVDLLFVGPFDLSANLGYLGQPDHPRVREAIARIEAAAKSAGKLLGNIPTAERSALELAQAGYGLILADADSMLLRDAARASIASFREGTA